MSRSSTASARIIDSSLVSDRTDSAAKPASARSAIQRLTAAAVMSAMW